MYFRHANVQKYIWYVHTYIRVGQKRGNFCVAVNGIYNNIFFSLNLKIHKKKNILKKPQETIV